MRTVLVLTASAVLTLAACSAQQQQRASSSANDTYLVTAVGAKIASVDVDAVTRVHVSANHGAVTLMGQAHSAQERLAYEKAAESVSGVTSVRNELVVNAHAEGLRGRVSDAALAARISASIAGEAGLNTLHVQPSVHQGNVTLRGNVPTQAVHQTVLQTVRGVPGVRSVVDQIIVRP